MDIQTAVRFLLPGELVNQPLFEGPKALTRYNVKCRMGRVPFSLEFLELFLTLYTNCSEIFVLTVVAGGILGSRV